MHNQLPPNFFSLSLHPPSICLLPYLLCRPTCVDLPVSTYLCPPTYVHRPMYTNLPTYLNATSSIVGLIKLLEKLANEKKKAGEAIFGAAVNATQSGLLENALFMKLALLQSIAQRGPELGGAVVNVVQV